jgi:excisionase family DNA binding protein
MDNIKNAVEAAAFLGVSKGHFYRLIQEGKIKHSKPGGKIIYVRQNDLEEYLLGKLNDAEFGGVELASEITGLCKETILNLCSQGLIPTWQRSGEYLFTRLELQLWTEEGRKKGLIK